MSQFHKPNLCLFPTVAKPGGGQSSMWKSCGQKVPPHSGESDDFTWDIACKR